MEKSLTLSQEEKCIGEKYLAKLESRARNWNRNRWIYVILAIISFAEGAYCLSDYYASAHPEKTVLDRLISPELSANMLPEYWFVAETRRTAVILDHMYDLRSIGLLCGVLGIFCIVSGILFTVLAISRWNDGPRNAPMAKLFRSKWNELICIRDLHKE